MGVGFKEIHDLLSSDLFLEGFFETITGKHANDQVLEPVILSHEQPKDGPI